MTDEPITYAKVGGPPWFWRNCKVYDRATGAEVRNVREVDTVAGFAVVLDVDEAGKPKAAPGGKEVATKRLEGDFEIRRIEE